MIKIRAEDTGHTRILTEINTLQGDLKKRTDKDIEILSQSIDNDGLILPMVVWTNKTDPEHKEKLLDGHGRYTALIKLALRDPSILTQPLPVLLVDAESEEEAKKLLLQISSQYGHITKQGLDAFTKGIALDPKQFRLAPKKFSIQKGGIKAQAPTGIMVRLRVDAEKASTLIELLRNTDGVTVL